LSQLRTNNWAIICKIGPRLKSLSDFRKEVVDVALAELLEQRGLSEGRYMANVVDGKVTF
jgi:hypothetical protein